MQRKPPLEDNVVNYFISRTLQFLLDNRKRGETPNRCLEDDELPFVQVFTVTFSQAQLRVNAKDTDLVQTQHEVGRWPKTECTILTHHWKVRGHNQAPWNIHVSSTRFTFFESCIPFTTSERLKAKCKSDRLLDGTFCLDLTISEHNNKDILSGTIAFNKIMKMIFTVLLHHRCLLWALQPLNYCHDCIE